MRVRTLAVAAALAVAATRRASAQHPLVELPLDDPAYVQLQALARQGCRPAFISPYRPYTIGRIRSALAEAATDARCDGSLRAALSARFLASSDSATGAPSAGADTGAFTRLRAGVEATVRATGLSKGTFHPLWEDVRPTDAGDPPLVGIVRGRVSWNGGPHLVAVAQAFAQTDRRNDPRIRARAFRSTSGVLDFDEAYLAGDLGPLTLSLGRGEQAWLGEGRESLMLSAQGPPVDRLSATAKWSRWEARALFGTIDDVVMDQARDSLALGLEPQRFHRFIAAHALSFQATPAVQLTLGETALLTRRGSGVDLAFANPVMLFVVTEHDSARTGAGADNDNLTAFGAVRVAAGRVTADAELTVDDIQIDAADRQRVPDQLAWRVSGHYGLPLAIPATLGLRYERIDSYTYMRNAFALAYQQYGAPLGSELGPDADLLRGEAELFPSGRVRLSGGLGHWRHGALRIDQRPGQAALGHAHEPFPSVSAARPDVQTAWLGDVALEWLDGKFPLTLRGDAAHITGVDNQPQTSATYIRVQLVGSYRFRFP